MKTIAFYNNKGGCGKSTSAINVAYALSETRRKILVIDCDSQKNTFNFFCENQSAEKIEHTRYEFIDLTVWREELLEKLEMYDYVVIDLPPAMNDYVQNILQICDYVFVPMEIGSFSIQGVSAVTNAIAQAGVNFGGCFAAKYDYKNTSDVRLFDLMKENLGNLAMNTRIPYSKVIKNSINFRLTAFEYMRSTHAVISLGDLTEEILERIGE